MCMIPMNAKRKIHRNVWHLIDPLTEGVILDLS
jgi:hypothetical protein